MQDIDDRLLRRFGQVVRMACIRLTRSQMNWQPEGKNRRRRQRKRWNDKFKQYTDSQKQRPKTDLNDEGSYI